MPPETFAQPPVQPRDVKPGDMVRVSARGYLVRDLNETLRRVSTNLDWEPSGPVETIQSEGYRRARMGCTLPNSATLDLIEATRWDSEAGLYLNSWGPGPYYIRIAVNDLAAKAEDLRARGTKFTWIEASDAVAGKALIRVDPNDLNGQLFEFEEC